MPFGKFKLFRRLLAFLPFCGIAMLAQTPIYNLGRAPTAEESRAMGYSVDPMGKGLPPGGGTATDGARIYALRCATCHGPAGEGTKAGPKLVGGKGTINSAEPDRTIGSFWPFAPPIFNMINRSILTGPCR